MEAGRHTNVSSKDLKVQFRNPNQLFDEICAQ